MLILRLEMKPQADFENVIITDDLAMYVSQMDSIRKNI